MRLLYYVTISVYICLFAKRTHSFNPFRHPLQWSDPFPFEQQQQLAFHANNVQKEAASFKLAKFYLQRPKLSEPPLSMAMDEVESLLQRRNESLYSALSSTGFTTLFPVRVKPSLGQLLISSSGLTDLDSRYNFGIREHQEALNSHGPAGKPIAPDMEDKDTILSLAKMSSNAYIREVDGDDWLSVDPWELTGDFGWESNGLRGYIYASEDDSVVIMSIKGTSASLFGRNGSTGARDKFSDNMMFSCCCARVDYFWTPVCGCYNGSQTCLQKCLEEAVLDPYSYFEAAKNIYRQVRREYPNSDIWFTGHSLGAALATLMALVHRGTSAVGYESPGDMLYAERLKILPTARDESERKRLRDLFAYLDIYHVGHLADPVFLGECTGKLSPCYYAGYALETKRHIGNVCVYQQDGGLVDITKHRINYVIDKVLTPAPLVPLCVPEVNVTDCQDWTFV